MTLTLAIQNLDRLENGEPPRLVLDRHGAVIGRSPHADWSLPDPRAYISSRHCEINYRDGGYVLVDTSTNGTFVNGAEERLRGPHALRSGDVIGIGHFRIKVSVQEGAAQAAPPPAEPEASGWAWEPEAAAPPRQVEAGGDWDGPIPSEGWDSIAPEPAFDPIGRGASSSWGSPSRAPPDPGGWAADEPGPAIGGRGALSQAWTPPAVSPAAPSWSGGPSSSVPAPAPASNVWAAFAESNAVDWGRGGFAAEAGTPWEPAMADPPSAAPQWSAPVAPAGAGGSPGAPAPAPTPAADAAWRAFLEAAGLSPADFKQPPAVAATQAGAMLRRLVSGLIVMLEARARAKAQLGAETTTLQFDGNNPLKFARSGERALAQLLNPADRGYLDGEASVEDAFKDLQAHQMATLAAMQGALRATLARFSPEAIRKRAEMRGLLARILPAAREATLWQAYEREFEGVAVGSDEAFMDVFAKAFREAYEKSAAELSGRRR